MNGNEKKNLWTGGILLLAFALWTVLTLCVDVRAVGVNGTEVGFAALNTRFHEATGVHMTLYTWTDRLSAVPFAVCAGFGAVGAVQLIRRRSLVKVDADILLLGTYYILVIGAYLFFDAVPVNYRPILIDGRMEASYPSSTTLLVMSVMPTLWFQTKRRVGGRALRLGIGVFAAAFTAFMVIGRAVSGVHWCTDIVSGALLSGGLFMTYRFSVGYAVRKTAERNGRDRCGLQ